MRIITGIYKGVKLSSPEGSTSRPTTDYTKEMTFSTLESIISGWRGLSVLDLYSGSGSLGLEALSRGAEKITFVDASKKAISTVIKNIIMLECLDKCKVILKKVETFLNVKFDSDKTDKYHIIFADPPFKKNLANKTIELIIKSNILVSEGVLVLEHAKDEIIHDIYKPHVLKEKHTRTTTISFLSITTSAIIITPET